MDQNTDTVLSAPRALLASLLGAIAVLPTALIVEFALQIAVRVWPIPRDALPLLIGGASAPPDASGLVKVVMALSMLLVLFIIAAVFCVVVGMPLLWLTRKARMRSSVVFAVVCGTFGIGLDQLTSEPRLRGAIWAATLFAACGGVMHFAAKRLSVARPPEVSNAPGVGNGT